MVRALHKLFPLSHNKAIRSLPKPYLDYLEKSRAAKERVLDQAPKTKYLDYDQDHDSGYVYRVPDQPIHVTYPPWSEHALWGGLGCVEAFHKPKKMKPRICRLWYPTIEKHTFYCEILDVYINVDVTDRTFELIDHHKGFDFYILATSSQDLVSEFGRLLKRKLQLALTKTNSEYIKQKYKDYIKPIQEVEWLELKEHEALTKYKMMRVEETIAPPLKLVLGRALVSKLLDEQGKLAK